MSILKEEDKNSIITYLNSGVLITSNLVLIPLVIRGYNELESAIYLLLPTLTVFASLLDFGYTSTLTRYIANIWNKDASGIKRNLSEGWDDRSKEIEEFMTSQNSLFVILCSALLICLPLASFLLLSRMILITDDSDLYISFVIVYMTRVFVGFLVNRNIAVLLGMNRVYETKKAELINVLIKNIVIAIILYNTLSLFYVFMVDLLFVSLLYFHFTGVCRNIFKRGLFARFAWNKEVLNDFWKPSYKWGLMQLGSFGSNYSSNFIISNFGAPADITIFLVVIKVLNFIKLFTTTPVISNIPLFIKDYASNNLNAFRDRFLRQVKKGLLYGLVLNFSFILGADLLFGFLEVPISGMPKFFLMAGCIMVFLECHHSMNAQAYMTSNRIAFVVPSLVTGGLIFLVSLYVVVYLEKTVYAIFIVQLISQLLINNWYSVYLNLNLMNVRAKDYFRSLIF